MTGHSDPRTINRAGATGKGREGVSLLVKLGNWGSTRSEAKGLGGFLACTWQVGFAQQNCTWKVECVCLESGVPSFPVQIAIVLHSLFLSSDCVAALVARAGCFH